MADSDLTSASYVNLAKIINSDTCKLGTGASTVGATAIGVDGSAADAKVVYKAGAFGGIVYSLMLSSNDTAAVNAIIYKLDGSTVKHLGIVNIPIGAGTNGTIANINALSGVYLTLIGCPIDANGNYFIYMKPNEELKIAVLAAMTANKCIWGTSQGLDLTE
jgi:hypothetical protein